MAAPAYSSTGLLAYGTGRTSSAIPVPTGVASGDVIVAYLYLESTYPTVTPPSGFTELTFATQPNTTTSAFGVRVFWKQTVAADTGTYTFTHVSAITQGWALRITGGAVSGSPVDFNVAAIRDSAGTVTPAVSGTTADTDLLLFWCATFGTASWTPPAGFTEIYDPTDGFEIAWLAQTSAGSTGSLTATASVSTPAEIATLLAISPPSSASAPQPSLVNRTARMRASNW